MKRLLKRLSLAFRRPHGDTNCMKAVWHPAGARHLAMLLAASVRR